MISDLKLILTKDCRVFKFLRSNAEDVCPDIPKEIKVVKLTDDQVFEIEGEKANSRPRGEVPLFRNKRR